MSVASGCLSDQCSNRTPTSSQSRREVGRANQLYLNSNGANAVRFLRQTIQVCAPGVSTSVNWTPLPFSQLLKSRLILISPSSVPQAIHNAFNLRLIVESTPGNWVLKSCRSNPPELKAPTQANWSR